MKINVSLINKGFTLIELLAVIVILAILALIAIPIVLNVINNSESESARVSAEKYLDAVELAIMNKKLNDRTNKLDGEYEIKDNGKKIESEDGTILNVEYDGNGLTEGTIIIKNKKVKKIKQTKIDKWYAYIVSGNVQLFDKSPEHLLTNSTDFKNKIKKISNNGTVSDGQNITSIEFLSWGKLPERKTLEELKDIPDLNQADVSANKDNSIVAYYDSGKVYIYSEGIIIFQNASEMFYGLEALTNIEFGEIDTSNVKSMSKMFAGCTSLTELDLSSFDTSNVTLMSFMFDNCSKLTSIDLSSIETSKVTHMNHMFQGCSSLTKLNLSSFDTSNVTHMSNMFYDVKKITSLDLSSFDTSNVTHMSSMFEGCSSLIELDLSSFDTSNVKNMSSMFLGCTNLTSIDLSNFNTSNITDMGYMFKNCTNLASLDLSNFDTSKVTNMSSMFSYCKKLKILDLRNFNTENVKYMGFMFEETRNLEMILVTNRKWTTSNASTSYMFYCSGISDVTYK